VRISQIVAVALACALTGAAHAQPGVGFGSAARGGEGRATVDVTTLADAPAGQPAPPGSLRAALAGGERRVRFRVSGSLRLERDLVVRHPHVTIDGSDAPGGGVALWGHTLVIEADDVVVRHLRFRGSHPSESHDGLAIGGGRDILVDHVSCSWATDECLSIYGYDYTGTGTVRDVTIQHSLIAEAPLDAPSGMLVDGDVAGVTWYRNVFAKNANRNPQITTGRRQSDGGDGGTALAGVGRYELVQNVVYDAIYGTRLWNQSPGWTLELDAIGNLWLPGPTVRTPKVPLMVFADPPSLGPIRVYARDNADPARGPAAGRGCDVFSLEVPNAPCAGWAPAHAAAGRQVAGHAAPPGRAADALEEILREAGATLPCRDAADRRVLEEVRSGSGRPVRLRPPLPDLTSCPGGGAPETGERPGERGALQIP
jgi:hypothetical protein